MKGSFALGGILLGTTIAVSSLVAVRAEYSPPPRGNSFLCSTGTACLKAKSTGPSTPAFLGTSTAGIANSAIVGTAAGTGVSGSGGTAGVAGTSTNGYGVTGSAGSNGSAGVYGQSNAIGSSSSSAGVYGYSSSGSPGIFGTSASGPGVLGSASSGDGLEGSSTGFNGVYGYTNGNNGSGTVSESAGSELGLAAYIQGDTSNTYLIDAYNTATKGGCAVDPSGDLSCTGTISGALRVRHRNSQGHRVLAYSSESASAAIEDAGEGRMFNGVATVMIPSDFAAVIDRGSDYYVFLTPLGDTRGLYVSMKTAAGFQVRENERGHASVAFDYRIVAKPLDATDERLPRAPRMRRHHVVAPPAPVRLLPPLKSP